MDDVILQHEEDRGIHRLVMDHGPNALDRPLMEALRSALHRHGRNSFIKFLESIFLSVGEFFPVV